MKYQSLLKVLVPLIFALALFAAGMGLLYQTPGQPYALKSFRGEAVTINGHGLYYWDMVSSAAQMRGNDLITLLVGVPISTGIFGALCAWFIPRATATGRLAT